MRTKEENLIKYKDGNLYCEIADIWIDPSKPVKRALITHAHFDHFTFACEEYISTKETAILLRERVGDNIKIKTCLLYTSPSPRDATLSRMPSSA